MEIHFLAETFTGITCWWLSWNWRKGNGCLIVSIEHWNGNFTSRFIGAAFTEISPDRLQLGTLLGHKDLIELIARFYGRRFCPCCIHHDRYYVVNLIIIQVGEMLSFYPPSRWLCWRIERLQQWWRGEGKNLQSMHQHLKSDNISGMADDISVRYLWRWLSSLVGKKIVGENKIYSFRKKKQQQQVFPFWLSLARESMIHSR